MAIVNGYEADPADVQAILAESLDAEDRSDPTLLYVQASKMQALYLTVAEELAKVRAQAVKQLAADMPYQAVADHLGLHKSRVGAMIASVPETIQAANR